jgi:AcrR family transcriptional regulator
MEHAKAMTDGKTDKPYHHGDLRSAVLDAALQKLRSDDPANLSLRELARNVGVRHSALYSHFRDRSAVLAALAAQGFATLRKDMNAVMSRSSNDIAALAGVYIAFARTNPAHYRVMFLPEVSSPENYEQIEEQCEACFKTLMDAVGCVNERPASDVHRRTVAIWSALHGIAALGDDSGPLHRQIPPSLETNLAQQMALLLADAAWPDD